jgi:PKD repeat protein
MNIRGWFVIGMCGVALGGVLVTRADATFTEVGATAGVALAESSRGVAWGDYNGDGDVDLYVANAGATLSHLYENNGDGTFSDVTAIAGVPGPVNASGVVWGDYDNDNDLDLYVAGVNSPNILYKNNGDGTFINVTATAGVGDTRATQGVSWADYNSDGWLDLFVANRYGSDTTALLYLNNKNGTFTDNAAAAGVAGPYKAFGGTWFDYDNDGDLDLYTPVDFGDDHLYQNNSDGTFSDVTTTAGLGPPDHAMGVAVGDYDNDGDLDLFVDNNQEGADSSHGPSLLYQNNGNGSFSDVTAAAGLPDRETVDWGANFVDYDNDGDLDLAVVAGGLLTLGEQNALFQNNGDGTFSDVTIEMGVSAVMPSLGSAWADYDNDGDLDWYIANEQSVSNRLFRNEGPVGNWLVVRSQGVDGNRHGIGARITLSSGGQTRIREIVAGSSFLSEDPLEAWFGLGANTLVDQVTVEGMAGLLSLSTDVAVNTVLTLQEGSFPQTSAQTVVSLESADVRFTGAGPNEGAGAYNIAMADLNGDGTQDVVIGAHLASPNNVLNAGTVYIVFGRNDFTPEVSLSMADVTIHGIDEEDVAGIYLFSRGDLNRDGLEDLVIGAPKGDGENERRVDGGEAYILFGRTEWPAVMELSSEADVTINAAVSDSRACGALSTGDVNGDGAMDLLCGARGADIFRDSQNPALEDRVGQAYILFGRATWPSVIDLSVAADVTLSGLDKHDFLGFLVSSGGDVNGDGVDDFLVSARWAEPANSALLNVGESYLFFGQSDLSETLGPETADVTFIGTYAEGESGSSLDNGGDVNGDGLADILIGAHSTSTRTGEMYLIYGRSAFSSSSVSLADADVVMVGMGLGDVAAGDGTIVTDFNGDGFDDILIGDPDASPSDDLAAAGEVYVILGGNALAATMDLKSSAAFIFQGKAASDAAGTSLNMSTGDMDMDGTEDLAIGAYAADSVGFNAGEVYLIYGNKVPTAVIAADALSGWAPFIVGFDAAGSSDSDGTITTYLWDFGDGTGDVGATVAHTYEDAGDYTATLTVTDDEGAQQAASVAVSVQAPDILTLTKVLWQGPICRLKVEATSSAGSDVVLTVTGFGDLVYDATLALHVGKFDNVVEENPVTIAVTSTGGGSAVASVIAQGVTTCAPVIVPPTAAIVATPTSGPAPLTVDFDGSSSSDSDGSIVTYDWDFGDGVTATGSAVSHTYEVAGSYTVTLTVTDNDGAQHATLLSITADPDTLAISLAVWSSSKQTLTVRATSSRSPEVMLTLDGFGDMVYNETAMAYQKSVTGVSASPTVTVTRVGEAWRPQPL